MRPEVDLLEHLAVDGCATFDVALGIFRGDAARLHRVIAALLTHGLMELAESAPAGMAVMPEWRWRELMRDTEFWKDPRRRARVLEFRATCRTLKAFEEDSRGFFDRLFADV